jgi:hypothetical protein
MKSTMSCLIAAAAFAFASFIPAAAAQDCASQGGILVHPGQGVEFSQISYSFDELVANVGLLPSSTAEVDIDVAQLQSVFNGGFLNIVTPSGWVTQNVPILPANSNSYYLATTLNLNVAQGIQLSNLNATVCYSSQALSNISGSSFDSFALGSAEYNGEGVGNQGMNFVPPTPPIGTLSFNGSALFQYYLQAFHDWTTTDVQTANNQCAPASVANSYAWLNIRWNVPIPDANIMGLRDEVAGSLVGAMDMDMQSPDPARYPGTCANAQPGRWVYDRAAGFATPAISQLQGAMQYLSDNQINLTLKHQGYSPFLCDGFTGGVNLNFQGAQSLGQGTRVDPNFIYNEVRRDSAVEYDAVWYSGLGLPAGGHAMDIIGAGTFFGYPWIYYVSDHRQTTCPGRLKNGTCPQFLDDDKGTTYTMNGKTRMLIDFSFLIPSTKTPNQQPLVVYGQMNGAVAVAVMTQHP